MLSSHWLSSPSPTSTQRRVLSATVAAVFVLGVVGAYQVGVRMRRPPSFRRGGAFVENRDALPPLGTDAADLAHGPFADLGSRSSASTPGSSSAGSSPQAGLGAPAGAAQRQPTTASTAGPSPGGAVRGGPPTGPASPATRGLPAVGTYTWNVSGTESATGFGSRSLPAQMTMVVHTAQGLGPEEVVADITYSSDHTEREIIGSHSNGLGFDFEGGQVRFGPMAQTNQGDYQPPMLQVPASFAAGEVTRGVSKVIASDGSTERTEDWTVSVLGRDTVAVAGQTVPTWVVRIDRRSEAGSSQQITRSRTYWYDPSRHLWIKYTEAEHGQQNYAGVTFTYDENLSATLTTFRAG